MRVHGSAQDLYQLLQIPDAHLTAEPTEAHHGRIRPAHLSALVALGRAPDGTACILLQGWLMRNTPTPPGVYLAALALVAGPNLVGNYGATALALVAGWRAQRLQAAPRPQE